MSSQTDYEERIIVVNGYKDGWIGDSTVYIGRPNHKLGLSGSPLANCFIIGRDGNRHEVCKKFELKLQDEISKGTKSEIYTELLKIAKLLNSGKSKFVKLACYCKPQECHGDSIKRAIIWLMENQNEKN